MKTHEIFEAMRSRDRPAMLIFEPPRPGAHLHQFLAYPDLPFRGTHLLVETEKDVLSLSPRPLLHALRIGSREQLVIDRPLDLKEIAAGVKFESISGNLERRGANDWKQGGMFWVNGSTGWFKDPNVPLTLETGEIGMIISVTASGPFNRLALLGFASDPS